MKNSWQKKQKNNCYQLNMKNVKKVFISRINKVLRKNYKFQKMRLCKQNIKQIMNHSKMFKQIKYNKQIFKYKFKKQS